MRKILLCALSVFIGSQLNAQNCMSDYQYQTPITVSNPNASTLTDFQVNLIVNTQALIAAGKLEASGNDLRFVDGCCTELCFWVESGMNTTTTSIWLRVPLLPASSSNDVYMVYGSTGASNASNAGCTFDLYDNFDSGTQSSFANNCGSISTGFSGGNMIVNWSSSGIMTSNSTFSLANTYTVESDVTGATGTWPGLYWFRTSDEKSYAILTDGSSARISVTGGGTGACPGHNWASSVIGYSSAIGIWDLTWIGTGNIISNFPTIGQISSTDNLYAKDSDLKLGIGGISSGTGTLTMNWIRVRKYAALAPISSFGTESTPSSIASGPIVELGASSAAYCVGDSLMLDAGAGFLGYLWSTADATQSVYVSTPGTYYVDVLNSFGCASSDTVTVSEAIPQIVDLGADTTLCGGSSIILDAGAGFIAYEWSPNGSTQTITATVDGTYSVDAIDVNGCPASDAIVLTFTPEVISDFSSSSVNLDATFTDLSTNGVSYLWDFGDGSGISTLMSPNYSYATTGTYNVCLTVTGASGCADSTCQDVVINNAGIDEGSIDFITVYPNPAKQILTVQSTSNEACAFKLVDLAGKIVLFGNIQPGKNDLIIGDVTHGVYVLHITQENEMYTERIVVE